MLSQTCRAFLIDVEPPLLAGELSIVVARLRATWSPDRLVELTGETALSVVKLATLCLGISGGTAHFAHIASLLKHEDEGVSAAAETAYWSLSFREYGVDERLKGAVASLREGRYDEALRLLDELIETAPGKAEAYHQRGLAFHAQERYAEALQAYEDACARNRYHFAALAGAGHVHVEREEYRAALDFYQRALDIHPRLEAICDIAPRLEEALRDRDVA